MTLAANRCLGVCNSVRILHLGAVYADVRYEKHSDHHYLHTSHNQVTVTGKQRGRKSRSYSIHIFAVEHLKKEEFFSRRSLLKIRKKKEPNFSKAMLSRQRHVVMRCVEIMVVETILVAYIYLYSPTIQKSNIVTNTKAAICG